jgi:predicted RNA-binding Zn-ribbon protein involved in translation (DUF1610 family)
MVHFEVSDIEQTHSTAVQHFGPGVKLLGNVMPETQPTIPTKYPIVRPPCPKCGREMVITRIEPDRLGYDLRTFECTKCGNETILMARATVRPLGHQRSDCR